MMTLEEARKRNDYKFTAEFAALYLPDLIKSMQYSENEPYFHETFGDGGAQFGIARLEIGNIDIELNLTEFGAEYFICVKQADGEWENAGYLEDLFFDVVNVAWKRDLDADDPSWRRVDVNFDSTEWQDELEQDMFRTLNYLVENTAWSYDKPNKYEMERGDWNNGTQM